MIKEALNELSIEELQKPEEKQVVRPEVTKDQVKAVARDLVTWTSGDIRLAMKHKVPTGMVKVIRELIPVVLSEKLNPPKEEPIIDPIGEVKG